MKSKQWMLSSGRKLIVDKGSSLVVTVWYSLYTVFTTVRPSNRYAVVLPILDRILSMGFVVVPVVVILEEHGFDYTVSGECDGRDSEAREGALEAVPPSEGAGVPPLFTVEA